MDMIKYLGEVEFAIRNLITTVESKIGSLSSLNQKILNLQKTTKEEYQRAEYFKDSDDPDDFMLGVGISWDTYFGPDKDLYHTNKEFQETTQAFFAVEFSITTLCSSILQISKQGISLVHGVLKKCPNGRSVGSQALKEVLWQGRNQGIHWEEGKFSQPVENCFNALITDFGANFSTFKSKNMSLEIVKILGWKTFDIFKADMLLIK